MKIYKIFRAPEWDAFLQAGETDGAPIDVKDGYIHFSTAEQVAETAAKHFAGESDLVLVTCETETLGGALKWEVSRGGAEFPHLYRRLVSADVIAHAPLPLTARGHDFKDALK